MEGSVMRDLEVVHHPEEALQYLAPSAWELAAVSITLGPQLVFEHY